jgi:hypothetical protein
MSVKPIDGSRHEAVVDKADGPLRIRREGGARGIMVVPEGVLAE